MNEEIHKRLYGISNVGKINSADQFLKAWQVMMRTNRIDVIPTDADRVIAERLAESDRTPADLEAHAADLLLECAERRHAPPTRLAPYAAPLLA